MTIDEIRSEAQLFLIQAAIKYDPNYISEKTGRPVKFTSYAYQFIRQNLARRSKAIADDWVKKGMRTIQDDDESLCEQEIDDEGRAESNEAARIAQAGMELLTKRERKVIALRFGIGCEQLDIDTASTALGMTRRRVQQIEKRAIRKMQAELANMVEEADDSP